MNYTYYIKGTITLALPDNLSEEEVKAMTSKALFNTKLKQMQYLSIETRRAYKKGNNNGT